MKYIALFLSAGLTFSYFACSDNPTKTSGGTSDNGNALVFGHIYNPDSTPAVGASVRFVPVGYNPNSAAGQKIDSTLTDQSGYYGLPDLPAGKYNVLAAGASGAAFHDSVTVADTTEVGSDTLRATGGIRGVVKLVPPLDSAMVFVILLGTNTYTMADSGGNFVLNDLALGEYRALVLTTAPDYGRKDTVWVVFAPDTTGLDTIVLQAEGIPIPSGLSLLYDALRQIVTLAWNQADTALVSGYHLFRRNVDSNTTFAQLIPSLVTDTMYADSAVLQDFTYEYKVKAVDKNANEGLFCEAVSVRAVSGISIRDTILEVSGELGCFVRSGSGRYYVTNFSAGKVEIFDPAGAPLRTLDVPGGFQSIYRRTKTIAIDASSNLYLAGAAAFTCAILKYDSLGNIDDTVYEYTESAKYITALALYKDTLFFSDRTERMVRAINISGDSLFSFGNNWERGDKLRSLACDTLGRIYVYCEVGGSDRIQVFDKSGKFLYEVDAQYGDENIFISGDRILLAGYEKVVCLELDGSLVFRITVPTPYPYIYLSPVAACFLDGNSIAVGSIEGYIAEYAIPW